jgi:protein-S-isoprenylcysteine O-methyltransferase Ste14
VVWAVYAAGWLIAVASTFMVDHLDFLGLRQAFRPAGYAPPAFRERYLYTLVRHPMMLGLLIAFWATPHLTVGHLVFALAGSGYIAVGVHFEERDLRRHLGDVYRDYAARVPAVVPVRRPASRSDRCRRSATRAYPTR